MGPFSLPLTQITEGKIVEEFMKKMIPQPTLKRQIEVNHIEDSDKEKSVWMPGCVRAQHIEGAAGSVAYAGCPRQIMKSI